MYEARNSIYCYPNTNILKNRLNIQDPIVLNDYEKRIVSLKLIALHKKGITGSFDISHFVSIHKFLFEDIYPFAGQFRSENIAKDNFSFAEFQYIPSELDRLFTQLKDSNFLKDFDKEKLSNALAYYWAELNVLHPFREGNGRTTREFLRQLSLKNGYEFDIHNVSSKDLLNASIRSIIDETELACLIYKSLEPLS